MAGTAVLAQQQRWAAIREDPASVGQVCARIAEGESVRQIAKVWDVPPGQLQAWLAGDAERWRLVEAAKSAWVHQLMDDVVAIADGEGEVARDRLRIDTRVKVAAMWSPERFGRPDVVGGRTQVNVVVNRDVRGVGEKVGVEEGT